MYITIIFVRLFNNVRSLRMSDKVVAVTSAFVLSTAGAVHAGGPGGNYIQGGIADWDNLGDGFNVAASFMAMPNVRLFADYTNTDLDLIRVGGGWIIPMDDQLSFEVGGSLQSGEIDDPVQFDDDAFGFHGVARFAATPELTLAGKLELVFPDDFEDETVIGVDADYRFMPDLSAFLSFDMYDEINNDLLKVGIRYHF